MEFAFENLGRWTNEEPFHVTVEQIRRYSRAIDDTNPKHLSGEIAPPTFAVIPAQRTVMGKVFSMIVQSERTGYDTRKLHGEHDLFLVRPIVPGARLLSRGSPIGIHVKATGTVVITRTETRNENGDLVSYQYFTNFIRGVRAPESAGEKAPPREVPADLDRRNPVKVVRYGVTSDQSFRYAEASGDHGTYHLDEEAAVSAGLPGIILHGLCTMAFGSRAVLETVGDEDGRRLKRLAVRFVRPVRLAQGITTSIWAVPGNRTHTYAFEIIDGTGQPVIQLGWAELAL